MHHFSHAQKVGLYTKIHKALHSKGVYIEYDYMVTEQSVEDELFAENARLRREMNIPVWRMENTTIIVAGKENCYNAENSTGK